ncbi:sushi, von Willebrand factor type A, EGF and pentraxin domain-containing protein 1-like isoform X2 [Xenia sp. Carnegie-2017]|uniref:sushi, von Willebrand factor type A, EGF and pentraxin domain-containing protein 1-like isoform X2 n=1 Tax=Xenia sp. Carnegie-2017 TaxID=2897299 RepID=UPI001F04B1CA|nr:sushi, von Willebrand factor type A, EGF and pentraxin domain-containing protein 1-like isoform X2 [Xenia sp. Carnegie-2017]
MAFNYFAIRSIFVVFVLSAFQSIKTVNCNSEDTCKGVLDNCCKYCDNQGQVLHKDDVCKSRNRKATFFDGNNINQYGIFYGPSPSLNTLTISLWTTVWYDDYYKNNAFVAMVSYADSQTHNAFVLIIRNSSLDIYIVGVKIQTGVNDLLDGKPHHLAVTWESSSGQINVYKDGMIRSTKVGGKSKSLKAGGQWVIGQDQDFVGGGFEKNDAFKGEIDFVYVWNEKLTSREIKFLAKNCNSELDGYIIAYDDFKFSKATNLRKPTCAKTF